MSGKTSNKNLYMSIYFYSKHKLNRWSRKFVTIYFSKKLKWMFMFTLTFCPHCNFWLNVTLSKLSRENMNNPNFDDEPPGWHWVINILWVSDFFSGYDDVVWDQVNNPNFEDGQPGLVPENERIHIFLQRSESD